MTLVQRITDAIFPLSGNLTKDNFGSFAESPCTECQRQQTLVLLDPQRSDYL